MSSLKIKVCGMRDSENIRMLAALKPDLVGFVFYPYSPRYAGEIPAEGLLDSIPPGIIKTGVFVDSDLYYIKAQVLRFGLRAVQLHGNESPEICKQVSSSGIKVIKAFRISENTDFSMMMPYVSCCKWFLFDTDAKIPGGSGRKFNWDILKNYKLGHPFFLSGGIDLGDAAKILEWHHPALTGVDINSKFETEPGMKDVGKVGEFIGKIRRFK
jgi:phosphoribosylanthranilate isomerase